MSQGKAPEQTRADAARAASDITWAERRTIYQNHSTYASIPPWAARNMGLDKQGAEFVPGYSPAGQSVVIEEAAIIIRLPTEDDTK